MHASHAGTASRHVLPVSPSANPPASDRRPRRFETARPVVSTVPASRHAFVPRTSRLRGARPHRRHRTAGAGQERRHRHRGRQSRSRCGLHRRAGLRRARVGRQRHRRHRAPDAACASFRRQGVHHAQHHPARRRARRRPQDGVAGARSRRGRADRPGHGPAAARPAAHPAPCEHADRHPHAREGEVPAGRRLLADGARARARPAPDPRHRGADAPCHARVLHPRRAVRRL